MTDITSKLIYMAPLSHKWIRGL